MLKLKKIAVTGGLSAGKTTVCHIFKELGAYTISADEIVHQLLSPEATPGTVITQQILNLLSPDVLSGNTIDRKKVAAKVFSKPDLLENLEKILHPAVFDAIERIYHQIAKENKHSLFVAEIPLFYEAIPHKKKKQFDAVISVTAEANTCKNRFIQKTQHTPEEFDKRMSRQLSPISKTQKADYIIENNGTLEELKNNTKALYLELTK